MDFTASHRTIGAKYGKNRGRGQLNSFYDIAPAATRAPPPLKRLPISPSSPQNEVVEREHSERSKVPPSPSPARSARPAHITSHSRSSASASHGSRSASPAKYNAKTSASTEKSTFDMLSSDDDLDTMEQRPVKKLRLSPIEGEGKRSNKKSRSKLVKKDEAASRPVLAKKQDNPSNKGTHGEGIVRGATAESPDRVTVVRRPEDATNLPRETVQPTVKKKLKTTYGNKSLISSERAQIDGDTMMRDLRGPMPSPRKSRTKLKPRANRSDTPRKLPQPLNDSDTSGASPSQLGLHDLRLTPERGHESPVRSASPPINPPAPVLPRGRKRLIDRLDTAANQTGVRAELAARNFAKEIERLDQGTDTDASRSTSAVPKLGRSGSSQTRQTYGRSRNTYAKERSHLSDMVDDLDTLSTASDHAASQQLLSGLLSSGPSQIQSQLEIESDSSDDAQNFRLKSVHELKQAGSMNRLEKEVEDLMSDINPTKGPKAIRIQALMQIMRKIPEDGFASFLFEYTLDRLTSWSSLMKDKISKLLLGMIFWRLVHCSVTSPLRLKQIIQTVMANSSAIPPLDTLSQIAKNRSENLSKSTIRDLVDFDQLIVSESLLPAYEGENVIPAAVTLGVLNDSIRKLVEAGTMVPLQQSSYAQIVALLEQASQQSGEQAVKHVFVTKLALSLLQICANPTEQGLGLSENEYSAMGDSLAGIVSRSMNIHEDLLQAVLHFTISLCNDKPNICRAICQSSLVASLMTIVKLRFLNLVNAAEDSQTVDATMLDSIILTLACLLNLTEHDDEVRRSFAFSTFKDSATTHLSRLVDIYAEAASRLTIASTTEQGSALVVLGYLSLLICNLCLKDELWQYVSDHLQGQHSISDVVASAKELLIHLRTVETAEDVTSNDQGAAALDGVTARFSDILSAVRLE